MISFNNNANQKVISKKINGYRNIIISFIVLVVLAITYPFIVAFVYLITSIFGQPISYLIGGLVEHLYVPILAILCGFFVFGLTKVVQLNFLLNRSLLRTKISIPNVPLKTVLIIMFIVVAGAIYMFGNLTEEVHLIQDIPHLIHSDFLETEGTITLYEKPYGEDSVTRVMINGIKMDGGNVTGEDLVDNEKYLVRYLPHSKYIVEYHRVN